MASLTCPNCGKDNPDFLDNCQFCQTPLRREATLNIGENPTKKSTGELEGVLPDWLREARQQGRESAEEEAKKEATKPKIQKAEPPDLLAGLAFQAASDDEEEVPDWLAAINPIADKKQPETEQPAEDKPSDFFAQFNQPAQPSVPDEPQNEAPPSITESAGEPQNDELGGWLSQPADEQQNEPFNFDLGESALQEPAAPPTPEEPEDLSWLHDLEASAKQAEQPSTPSSSDTDWMSNLGASESGEDLSWLNNLGGTPAPGASEPTPPQPAASESQEELSWLDSLGGTPAPEADEPAPSQPASPEEDLSWLNNLGGTPLPESSESAPSQPASSEEDLSWLNNLGGAPASESSEPTPSQPVSSEEDLSWLDNLGGTPIPESSEPTPSQPASSEEDLSWLNNLGGAPASESSEPTPSQPASSEEDLSWLNNLGDTPAPEASEPTPSQPALSEEDLSRLSNLGGTPAPETSEPTPSQPASSEEGLSWLDNLGGTPAPETSEPTQPASSEEDLSWLSNLGGTPAPEASAPTPPQPNTSEEDLNWLNNLGGTPAPEASKPAPLASLGESENLAPSEQQERPSTSPPQFSPAHTAPLSPEAAENMPDWLKSAIDEPSMPPLGATSEWFQEGQQPSDELPLGTANVQDELTDQTQGETAPAEQDLFASTMDSSSISDENVDALFDVDMPDWLSQPEPDTDTSMPTSMREEGSAEPIDDSLSPVNLPSWVQAMRPVDAGVSETASVTSDQTTEREGPLAGFRGVIPFVPIGSAQRPKPISLKLQATDEQQATAALLEQIIASETVPQPPRATSFVASQRTLRWILTGVFVIILGVIIALGSQFMPVVETPAQINEIGKTSGLIASLPQNAPVLVVIDYEPSLSGEMEAVSGPLLNQMAILRQLQFTFISSSPNGPALAERLLKDTRINLPKDKQGLDYQPGLQYFNIGYLPGGSTGVQGFMAAPNTIIPDMKENAFSDFAAVVVITDHAESGLVWIEQVQLAKQSNSVPASQPLLIAASAQAGPMLQPYVSSKQVAGMISGMADAVFYEHMNNSQPGIARAYWDAFGVGLLLAVVSIVLGSLWNLVNGIRMRRAEADHG